MLSKFGLRLSAIAGDTASAVDLSTWGWTLWRPLTPAHNDLTATQRDLEFAQRDVHHPESGDSSSRSEACDIKNMLVLIEFLLSMTASNLI
jgi:hypothetical protein